MSWLMTAEQMRKAEAAAVRDGQLAPGVLMGRAGAAVVKAIFDQWPEMAARRLRALVLCGPGNNGGDGFVVARLLQEWGAAVQVVEVPGGSPPGDARVHRERLKAAGLPIMALGSEEDGGGCGRGFDLTEAMAQSDLIIDALFGLGLSRPLSGQVARMVQRLNESAQDGAGRAKVVAIDIPSGLDGDSGRVPSGDGNGDGNPSVVHADLTVSFHAPKPGHYLSRGPALCGALRIMDIGLGPQQPTDCRLSTPDRTALAKGGADGAAHKYGHGHAVIMGGPSGAGGAARLAARAALRIGAGLVTLACPPEALAENAARLDAIMLTTVRDADALKALLADTRIGALCLGPGLGMGDGPGDGAGAGSAKGTRDMVATALAADRAVVLDADALSAHAHHAETLFKRLHSRAVLTPHDGEFARLFPDLAALLRDVPKGSEGRSPRQGLPRHGHALASRLSVVRAAAARAGCTVLLKGPDTVMADPSGAAVINDAVYDRAAPWLATAGAGDVLSGLVAGLMARGMTPLSAAETASWLHTAAARAFGPGLIAEDLPEMVPRVLAGLLSDS